MKGSSLAARAVGLGLAAAVPPVLALEMAPYPVGPINLYPSLGLQEQYVDNYFYTPSNEDDTWVSMLLPRVEAVLDGGRQLYSLRYQGEVGRVHSFQEADYSDHDLMGQANWTFSRRLRGELMAGYLQEHDELGTERTEGLAAPATGEPDEWHAGRTGGTLTYGAPGASGQLELGGTYTDKTYDNNRTFTRFRDLDEAEGRATFYWRVMPKTRALFEVRHRDVDYERDAPGVPTLDSAIRWYLTGATWEATGRTTGAVRVGRVERDYDAGARNDSSDFSWEVSVAWAPRTYSTFELTTARTPQETDNGLTDSGYLSDSYALRWTHEWRARLRSVTDLYYANEDYDGFPREDDVYGAGLELRYAMRRWLDLGLGYRYAERDSNFGVFEYDRNVLMLSVDMSL